MNILTQLFFAFIQVGMFSVGGGYAAIPLIQNQIVDIHGLMTLAEFTDLITIAEMTPGPISINSATFVGMRLAGIPGVLLCRKNASLTRSACSGRHRAQTLTARRPFFMQMDSCQASSAPASISFSAR